MDLSFSFDQLLLFLIALIAVFSPFAVIGPYAVFTEGFSKRIQCRIAFMVSLGSAAVLVLTVWVGETLLNVLGISVGALGAAGGLVLILSSLPMILEGESPRKEFKPEEGKPPDEGWEKLVVSPLVFPLTVGAGTMSLVITQTSMAEHWIDKLALTGVIVIDGCVILITYLFSVPMSGRLGGRATTVITRIGGIILLSLAFNIFTNGLKMLLPGLAR